MYTTQFHPQPLYSPSTITRIHHTQLIISQTFTKWCNSHLKERMLKIENLETDLADGVALCALLELISSKKLVGLNSKPKIRVQKLENNGAALRFLKSEGIKLVAIGPEGIVEKNTEVKEKKRRTNRPTHRCMANAFVKISQMVTSN